MKNFLYIYKEFLIQRKEFFIGLLLTTSILWPLFAAPFFKHHDDVQVIRLYEMDKCFKDGQIPCRWVPDLGGLYGYPIFNYYAALPYYFGEIFYLLTSSLILSVKIMFATAFLGSYVFMFLLGQKFWGKLGGSLSAIFYSFAPYHALDFYVRGAMGEMWALMFFPAIFWALVKLKEKTNILNMLLVGIFIAALSLSHNLSTMIFLPITIFWITILVLYDKRPKFLYFSFLSLMLGIMLSAFYVLPMIFEKNLVHVDTTTYGYFGYTEHFKGIRELFVRRDWGWGSSIREVPGAEKETVSFQIGWVHLLGWVMAVFSIKFFWKKNPWIAKLIFICSLIALFSIFMIHPKSQPIWNAIYPLKYLQFPWRFMMLVIFFLSFMTGALLPVYRGLRNKVFIILIILVVALNFSYFRPEKFLQVNDQDLLSGENWDRQIKRSIFDFLPIYAKEPPRDLATERYQILTGEPKVSDFKEGTNWISFKVKSLGHTIIRLSQYYFPDWKIFVNGKEAKIDYTSSGLGLMTIILGEGDHNIEARLYDTTIRTVSNLITLISAVLMVILFLLQFKGIRKWILYYRKRID